jgi:hypothetical protein
VVSRVASADVELAGFREEYQELIR